MERPFYYGGPYEQQLVSMLASIDANMCAQNSMLGGYIDRTDKKIEELKKNKKRKRISDNICVLQDGTINLLEVYDNGDKIAVPFIVNIRGGWEVYRLKFDKITVSEEYFILVFRNSSIWIAGKYTKNTQTGLYNYFIQSGVKFNIQISQNRIKQALYMEFAPQIENATQTWTLTELAGWSNGKFMSAENFPFGVRQDFPRLPIMQKRFERVHKADNLQEYLRIFQMMKSSKDKVLLQEVVVWGLLASIFAAEGMKAMLCLNLVFLQGELRPIFSQVFQVFNRSSSEVICADWNTAQVKENLISCNDEILIVDAFQTIGNTYQKQKVKENVEKIRTKICEEKTRVYDISREINCGLVVMNTEILQGNAINIFITEDFFDDVSTVENVLNGKVVEIFLTRFIEFSENNLTQIRRIIRKNRVSCQNKKISLLQATWQILNLFWEGEGVDLCVYLSLMKEMNWEEMLNQALVEEDALDIFVNAIRTEIPYFVVLPKKRNIKYEKDAIYFDKDWLYIPTKVLDEMLKHGGMLSKKSHILYSLKKAEKLKCDQGGLSKKVQVESQRREYYCISKAFFDRPGIPSIVDLGGINE